MTYDIEKDLLERLERLMEKRNLKYDDREAIKQCVKYSLAKAKD